jgi:hypothetical protein
MEREEVSAPELIIADEARIGCQKPLRGLEGTGPKLRVHRMTVDVRVLDDQIRPDFHQFPVDFQLTEDVFHRVIGVKRDQDLTIGNQGLHPLDDLGRHGTPFDEADARVRQCASLRSDLDIDAHDSDFGIGSDLVEQRGEEQEGTAVKHPRLDDRSWTQTKDQLLIELEIERTLLDGISQECILLPGLPTMVVEIMKSIYIQLSDSLKRVWVHGSTLNSASNL